MITLFCDHCYMYSCLLSFFLQNSSKKRIARGVDSVYDHLGLIWMSFRCRFRCRSGCRSPAKWNTLKTVQGPELAGAVRGIMDQGITEYIAQYHQFFFSSNGIIHYINGITYSIHGIIHSINGITYSINGIIHSRWGYTYLELVFRAITLDGFRNSKLCPNRSLKGLLGPKRNVWPQFVRHWKHL